MCTATYLGIMLRPAALADVEWLTRLRIRTMGPHLEAAGDVIALGEQRARVVQDFECIQVVERSGEAIGMLKVVKAQEQWKLVQIQLEPAYQGLGIGGMIVSQLLDDARQAHAPVTLTVLKVNPAKRLYDRLGFRVVAEKERSYEMRADA